MLYGSSWWEFELVDCTVCFGVADLSGDERGEDFGKLVLR